MEVLETSIFLPIVYENYHRNFYVAFEKEYGKFVKEKIKCVKINLDLPQEYKYENDLVGATIIDILNNKNHLFSFLDKFDYNKITDYNTCLKYLTNFRDKIYSKNKNYLIIVYQLEKLIFSVKEAQDNNVNLDKVKEHCKFIFGNIKYQIKNMYEIVYSFFFNEKFTPTLENEDNTFLPFYVPTNQFRGCDLQLPPVKITYQKDESNYIKQNQNGRYNPIETTYEYGIETLEDLTNVSIYHISCSKKAILQCSVCNTFFVPHKHEGIGVGEEITERNDRKTCSPECSAIAKTEHLKSNFEKHPYKKIHKNICDLLRKRDREKLEQCREEFRGIENYYKEKLDTKDIDNELLKWLQEYKKTL